MILESQELNVTNLLTFRGKVKQEELSRVILSMRCYAEARGAKIVGGPISVTYGVEQTTEGTVADAELMLPLDKKVSEAGVFGWKEHLFLSNAVRLNYTGTPAGFQTSCNELNAYLLEKGHTPITAGYIRTSGVDERSGIVDMEVYVGVNPNVV